VYTKLPIRRQFEFEIDEGKKKYSSKGLWIHWLILKFYKQQDYFLIKHVLSDQENFELWILCKVL